MVNNGIDVGYLYKNLRWTLKVVLCLHYKTHEGLEL